jgi:phage gpG-like protein
VSTITLDELHAKLMRWSVLMPEACKKALTEGAELVRREAQASHLSGPKMPRGVGDDQDATLAVRTGFLRRSISRTVDVHPGEVSAFVGTPLWYGRVHELGLGKMPRRSFLRPSLEFKHDVVFEMLRKRFFESYQGVA